MFRPPPRVSLSLSLVLAFVFFGFSVALQKVWCSGAAGGSEQGRSGEGSSERGRGVVHGGEVAGAGGGSEGEQCRVVLQGCVRQYHGAPHCPLCSTQARGLHYSHL